MTLFSCYKYLSFSKPRVNNKHITSINEHDNRGKDVFTNERDNEVVENTWLSPQLRAHKFTFFLGWVHEFECIVCLQNAKIIIRILCLT